MQMKNSNLEISNHWNIIRDEFFDLDPKNESISPEETSLNLYDQEDLLLINNGDYYIDLGWYSENGKGCFVLFMYRGVDWHNCQLLEKFSTVDYLFLTKSINTIARNIDDGLVFILYFNFLYRIN